MVLMLSTSGNKAQVQAQFNQAPVNQNPYSQPGYITVPSGGQLYNVSITAPQSFLLPGGTGVSTFAGTTYITSGGTTQSFNTSQSLLQPTTASNLLYEMGSSGSSGGGGLGSDSKDTSLLNSILPIVLILGIILLLK